MVLAGKFVHAFMYDFITLAGFIGLFNWLLQKQVTSMRATESARLRISHTRQAETTKGNNLINVNIVLRYNGAM